MDTAQVSPSVPCFSFSDATEFFSIEPLSSSDDLSRTDEASSLSDDGADFLSDPLGELGLGKAGKSMVRSKLGSSGGGFGLLAALPSTLVFRSAFSLLCCRSLSR